MGLDHADSLAGLSVLYFPPHPPPLPSHPSQGHGCRREHWGLFSTQHGTGPLDDKIAGSTNISCVGFCSQAPGSPEAPTSGAMVGKEGF